MDFSATFTMKSASSTSSIFFKSKNPNFNSKKPFFNLSKTRKAAPLFFKSFKCLQSPESTSQNPILSSFSCSAVTFTPAETADHFPCKLRNLITEFQSLPEPVDRVKRLLHYSTLLSHLPESSRVDSNRVMGCTARVWLEATLDKDNKMRFRADSDSEITRGFCYCLVSAFDGAAPEEVLSVKTEDLAALNVGLVVRERSRVNTWHNVLISMQKRTKALVAEREGKKPFEPFPSLIVTEDGVQAKGSYAEAQNSLHTRIYFAYCGLLFRWEPPNLKGNEMVNCIGGVMEAGRMVHNVSVHGHYLLNFGFNAMRLDLFSYEICTNSFVFFLYERKEKLHYTG